ncbi:acyl-CoA/acyl-ACP dehydrogenase [Acinetobacter towneri]|uniref:acyl-CoA dehydrogenase family protein n=1 Tax=Acinetobacter towneri TaxID=202956 RepID=UPI002579202F|nr:acyl-CoA dehydrogenase family protein [Acinetobacter towneri]MDM1754556.1 acyl-CoA/acyl-ACP dehydrogenase [Acinetobacter towneri]
MTSLNITPEQYLDADQVLMNVKSVILEKLAPKVQNIDEGYYPLDVMQALAQTGALGAHLKMYGSRYDLALKAMHEVGKTCGSTAFLMWCHMVCGLYMQESNNPALIARLKDHAEGKSFGGTALSNPMKAFAGIEKMVFKAKKLGDGFEVSGTLPWVSHIQTGQYCGAIATVESDDPQQAPYEIMFLLDLDERVKLSQCPEFSGMEGTSTWRINLDGYVVSPEQLIAVPAKPFIQSVKHAFVLLQAGMASGLIAGSIDSILEVRQPLGHVNQFLEDSAEQLQAELDDLLARVMELAKQPLTAPADAFLDVLDARAEGATLALRATQSALLHQGARGYLKAAAPQRRIREAHFVAIVTPAIKHLRWEMQRLLKEELPA